MKGDDGMVINRIYSIALLVIGALISVLADGDATALVFIAFIAVPMFFSKKRIIY